MSQSIMRLGFVTLLTLCGAAAAGAQAGTPAGDTAAANPVFTRARQLVVQGNGAAGRMLVDSVLAAQTPGTPGYADALYWRAALAANGADAERDYRQIVVDYPVSTHAGDALLQLSQLEAARGDRSAAVTHLERFMLENPTHPQRTRAGLSLIRLLVEGGDMPKACAVLERTEPAVPTADIELRNQFAYFDPRCAGVDTTERRPTPREKSPPTTAAHTPNAPSHTAPHTESHTAPPHAAAHAPSQPSTRSTRGRYTLQVAAYTDRAEADRLAKRLVARGLEARVVGTAKLFRVRIGNYPTRAAANAAAKELKAKKIESFVTEVSGERP